MKIEKNKTEHGYQFAFTTKEGTFYFSYGGNLDLYFTSYEEGEVNTFTIDYENYELYLLFDKLYNRLMNYDYLKTISNDEKYFRYLVKIEKNKEYPLIKNNTIEWHCDDHDYDSGCILKIKKTGHNYILTIDKKNNQTMFGANSVRIRNSGSRYHGANMEFMYLYTGLINYEDSNQISIEEYMHKVKSKHK